MSTSIRVLFALSLASLATLAAPASPGTTGTAGAQSFPSGDIVIRQIWEEGVERSQVNELGQVMMD